MFMYLHKNKKGFTLIELMVVVAIIGILALLGLRLYTGQQEKAKNAIVKANAGTIQTLIQAELADAEADDTVIATAFTNAGIRNPFTGAAQTANDATTDVVGAVWVERDDATYSINGTGGDGEDVYDTHLIAQK